MVYGVEKENSAMRNSNKAFFISFFFVDSLFLFLFLIGG